MDLDSTTARIAAQPGSTWSRTQGAGASARALTPVTHDWSEPITPSQQLQDNREQTVAMLLEIAALEAEVERQERRLQTVTEQYERLLAERNRQLAEAGQHNGTDAAAGSLLSTLRRHLPAR